MADVSSIGGETLTITGWIVARDFTDPQSGEHQTIYKGRMDNLAAFLTELKKANGYDKIEVQKEESTATATVTITKTYGEDKDKPAKPGANEVALPDVTLQGSMIQVPLCQAPIFGLSEEATSGLTVQRIKQIDYIIREKGTITQIEAGNELAQQYASWLLLGMKTFEKPVYTLSITHHLRIDKAEAVATFIQTAGTILTFAAITGNLPKRKKPYRPDGFDEWLAQAPSVKYGENAIDVSQTFIGAKKWPTYYPNGTWTPPGLEYRPTNDGGANA